MYTPHTVTIINATEGEDYEMQYNLTVLHGVMLQASKRNNVNKSGLTDADAVTLFIPFSVQATDATGSLLKVFRSPKAYAALVTKDLAWTLQGGDDSAAASCFFIKGEVTEALSYADALNTYDEVYRVTSVDIRDFGSASMQHWQVGGV